MELLARVLGTELDSLMDLIQSWTEQESYIRASQSGLKSLLAKLGLPM